MRNILVVGGAGYIGSHMVKALYNNGFNPITLDDLSTGFADAVRYGELITGSIGDRDLLDKIFDQYRIRAVMHFAAYSQVGESVSNPAKYYRNNVVNTQTLLEAMIDHRINRMVFSSTAAVYGNPISDCIDESHPKNPINPYGKTKWMIEQMLADYDTAYGLKSIALRYFNAAGADDEGELGERHDPETHLIPLVLQAGLGQRDAIGVFGQDYPTADGTCIRDYIHIQDLCSAHLSALHALCEGGPSTAYNLGNGSGFSVQQVIQAAEQVLEKQIPVRAAARRTGDPAVLVADATRARDELGWQPAFTDLNQIIAHAAAWEKIKIERAESHQQARSPVIDLGLRQAHR